MQHNVQPTISSAQTQSNAATVPPPTPDAMAAGSLLARCLLGGLLCFALSSCDKPRQTRLRDTEDRRFALSCEHGSECELTALSSGEGEETAFQLKEGGRLQAVCVASVAGKVPQASDCRALLCDSDDECPPDRGSAAGHCINGLCVDPAKALGPDDAVMLCLAGTGLGRKRPEQVERYAMALNCGDPCQVPRPCRQP